MKTRSKLIPVALTAAFTLGAFISIASANRIAMKSSATGFRATWNVLAFKTNLATVECHVTLEGSFDSRTIMKLSEQRIGYISRASFDEGRCTGGSARALAETLPWHIRYEAFTGTLPTIEGIRLRVLSASVLLSAFSRNCLFRSTFGFPLKAIMRVGPATGQVEDLTPESSTIPQISGELLCPTNGTVEGVTTNLTLLGSTGKISVTLVQ